MVSRIKPGKANFEFRSDDLLTMIRNLRACQIHFIMMKSVIVRTFYGTLLCMRQECFHPWDVFDESDRNFSKDASLNRVKVCGFSHLVRHILLVYAMHYRSFRPLVEEYVFHKANMT